MHKVKTPFTWRSFGQLIAQIMLDIIMINAAMLLALNLRYDFNISTSELNRLSLVWPIMTGLCLGSFAFFRMYQSLWQYAGLNEGMRIFMGTAMGMGLTMVFSMIMSAVQPGSIDYFLFSSKTVYPIAWFILLLLTAGQRFSIRLMRTVTVRRRATGTEKKNRVMIVGAGWAGSALLREYSASGYRHGTPVIIVDDDPHKAGTHLGRFPVLIGTKNIPQYAEQYEIDEIVIAIPSATPEALKAIMEACTNTNCRLKLVPGMRDVSDGELHLGRMRDVNITDLLFREEVKLDMDAIRDYLGGKVVLVTGGGGSIGSELCRQIAPFHPSTLVIFDIYENSAYELSNELKLKYGNDLNVVICIGSIRDQRRVDEVFRTYRPSVVFHAAAHKHVPLMEHDPAEAVKNNIFGTLNVARAADQHGVKRFVLISTDKAVNPPNVYGATKRVTELIIRSFAEKSKTRFMAVRFGNVLGSNGSVIPLFMRQIAAGGPVMVMHPEITRYFMTIPEASQLVLQAAALGESGAIYVLDMGTPVRIMDLARNVIRLSGYIPDEEIKIVITGLRPGEKLYEELMMASEEETMNNTMYEKIFIIHPDAPDEAVFAAQLDALSAATDHPEDIRAALKTIVPSVALEPEGELPCAASGDAS